ncbi:MAG: hypothetical protein Nk1A_5220 [Endomicrobiia bacterium]|nr:MAG: hypothetical protein Nk1A_5220 [Endomicrobiia bacterium]
MYNKRVLIFKCRIIVPSFLLISKNEGTIQCQREVLNTKISMTNISCS